MKMIAAPKHLRTSTRKWFASVVEAFELDEHHIKLLTKACEAHDRGEQAREALAKDGLTYPTRTLPGNIRSAKRLLPLPCGHPQRFRWVKVIGPTGLLASTERA